MINLSNNITINIGTLVNLTIHIDIDSTGSLQSECVYTRAIPGGLCYVFTFYHSIENVGKEIIRKIQLLSDIIIIYHITHTISLYIGVLLYLSIL